jgi:uncharacterized protein (DUF58 family)
MPLNRSSIEHFKNLELLAKKVVEGFITGLHKSPFHGFSVEFAEHRLYNTGESTRHIDWKLYGRTDKLFVKRYEEETNLRCQIIIDNSSSMLYPVDREMNKIRFSAYAAAALNELLKHTYLLKAVLRIRKQFFQRLKICWNKRMTVVQKKLLRPLLCIRLLK